MKKISTFAMLSALISCSMFSCQTELENINQNATVGTSKAQARASAIDDAVDAPLVLGKQLSNPYTVKNMQQAMMAVSKSKIAPSIKPTHLYVRFLPKNAAEMKLLTDDKTLPLYDYPLDYQIAKQGKYYRDPNLPASAPITWQYSVVPATFKFPNLKYEMLSELYLPSPSEVAFQNKALELSTAAANNSPEQTNAVLALASYRATGYVYVEDELQSGVKSNVPLRNATIWIKNWFHIERVKTNASGFFQSSRWFTGKVDVKVIFDNERLEIRNTDIWIFNSAEAKIGSEVTSVNYTFKPSTDAREWAWAFTHNTVEEYVTSICPKDGLIAPNKLRIWVKANKNSNPNFTSAPMLGTNKNIGKELMRSFLFSVFLPLDPITATLIQEAFYANAPDVTLGINRSNVPSPDDFYEDIIHELSHTSHYYKTRAGTYSDYWDKYVKYIINQSIFGPRDHTPYGNGTASDAGLSALAEGWAYYRGYYLTGLKYPKPSSKVVYHDYLEKTPIYSSSRIHSWFINGFLWDLHDKTGEVSPVVDNVNGDDGKTYNSKMMFNCLEPNVRSNYQFKERFKTLYGSAQKTQIDDLFKQYKYTN